MGSLEEQLKKWKQKQPEKAAASSPSASASAPARKKATKKEPFPPQVVRAKDEKPAPKPRSDAELFAEAVDSVDDDAVLEKFSAPMAPSQKKEKAAAPPPPSDAELFAQFVGDGVNKKR